MEKSDNINKSQTVTKTYENKFCVDFEDVLNNCDNQVLVKELLNTHVPIELKMKITYLFNHYVAVRNKLNGF